MRIIISPAKQMRVETDSFACTELPVFLDKTEMLKDWISALSYEQQKALWACNDKIARQNADRFAQMDVFEDGQYEYVQEHLRILSGFYGVLKPMDGVVPYRLEMQAKVSFDDYKNLYDFWGGSLYQKARDDSGIIINLASKEYSRCLEKYLQPDDRFITCIFGEPEDNKIVQKGTGAAIILMPIARPIWNLFSSAREFPERKPGVADDQNL